ncbi:hypothetical protein [Buchnera aphidicola]|nr:hypothetical protein [Buchnera aphidicola]
MSYCNVFLGGIFGIIRGLLLVFFILHIFSYITLDNYNYYMNHSVLIFIFLNIYDIFNIYSL